MDEKMGKEEWVKWFTSTILPPPHNEWGISREEFQWVSGWNDLRICIIQRLTKEKESEC